MVKTASKSAVTPRPKGIGAYTSGRTDVSERAEELLCDAARRKFRLPLVRSRRPGRRRLANAGIEEI